MPALRALLALPLCALIPCGCIVERETIRGTDSSTVFPALRATWALDGSEEGARPSLEPLLDLEVSSSRSGFSQGLAAGELVEVGGTLFAGPGDVDVDFDLLRATIALRLRSRAEAGFGLDLIFGLGISDLDLHASAAGVSADESDNGIGPLLGLGLFYQPSPRLRLYAEVQVGAMISNGWEESVEVEVLDLGASVRLAEHVHLNAGWRQVSYEAENDLLSSNLDLTASGPLIGLTFSW